MMMSPIRTIQKQWPVSVGSCLYHLSPMSATVATINIPYGCSALPRNNITFLSAGILRC